MYKMVKKYRPIKLRASVKNNKMNIRPAVSSYPIHMYTYKVENLVEETVIRVNGDKLFYGNKLKTDKHLHSCWIVCNHITTK